MNIAELSEEFLDTLTDEQRAVLLKNIVKEAQAQPEPERMSETVEKKDQGEFIVPSRKVQIKNQPVAWEGNTFVDTGVESQGEEFETPKVKPAARVRAAPVYKTVRCNLCHNDFEKRADHIYGKYNVCNECGGRK